MDILNEMYHKSVTVNERNIRFWDEYLQSLKAIDFTTFSEKLKIPVLVPIGSRILFRGELKHTNEVCVALGADYFVKCSLKQAEVLRQHRIKGAQERFDSFYKEKEYLQNQMSFSTKLYENEGREIIEYHTAEEEKAWKEKHRANVKEYVLKRRREKQNEKDGVTDEELWNKLEELELQEDLDNELDYTDNNVSLSRLGEINENDKINMNLNKVPIQDNYEMNDKDKVDKEIKNKNVTVEESKIPNKSSKFNLLQQVIDRQNDLGEKLQELKNRKSIPSKTENDLFSKLEELELLDELEDEIDRLSDIIDNEDIGDTDLSDSSISDMDKPQRRVSFVDEGDSETLNLTFKHSEVEPNKDPYNPDKGIQKPSDIYEEHSNLFDKGTTSILKKSKYAKDDEMPVFTNTPETKIEEVKSNNVEKRVLAYQDNNVPQTIVIKDVAEKVDQDGSKLPTEAKPMSLFKKKRMQNKT